MAKVWGLNIPEEFAQFFQDFFKLDWQASNRRITKKKSTPGKIKGSWLAEFSKLPGYAQSWAGLTEQQQNTFITDWGSNAQQAFALYTQQCWYRELNSMPARTTADYYSHPIGHIHAAESDSDILLNFEVASGDYIMSAPSNIKKIQIPTQQFFANLTQLNFSLKIRQSGASDNGTIWYLYYIKIYGDDPETPKYEDESEEWTDIMAGAALNLQADNIDEWMDGEAVSKIQVSLELYIASGDLWIYDANITGIDSILGVIRLNNSNFLADISEEFKKYVATIKNQWSISDAAAGSYLQYDYPYANGLTEADEGWYLTRIADISETATIETAQDSDGSHLIAAVYNGRLYTSADGGASWTERQPAGATNKNWCAVASDGDGSHLIAAIENEKIYESTDGGASWTEIKPVGGLVGRWQSLGMSDDGSNQHVAPFAGKILIKV